MYIVVHFVLLFFWQYKYVNNIRTLMELCTTKMIIIMRCYFKQVEDKSKILANCYFFDIYTPFIRDSLQRIYV